MRVEQFTVGWICAIPTEYAVACELLDEEYAPHDRPRIKSKKDYNSYSFGRIGEHNVVIACLPNGRYGTSSTAVVAERMKTTFPALRFGLVVGIAGGAPSSKHDIRLGDVVVSSPTPRHGGVIQYDFGKAIQEYEFEETGHLAPPPEILLNALAQMRSHHSRKGHQILKTIQSMVHKNPRLKDYGPLGAQLDRLYKSDYLHRVNEPCHCQRIFAGPYDARLASFPALLPRLPRSPEIEVPVIHYGLIASANRLLKDAIVRDNLSRKHGVLCFEMEAGGLMNNFPCVVIRGISDYSDTHKNDFWQPYAAATAAAYAKELLGIITASADDSESDTESNNRSLKRMRVASFSQGRSVPFGHRQANESELLYDESPTQMLRIEGPHSPHILLPRDLSTSHVFGESRRPSTPVPWETSSTQRSSYLPPITSPEFDPMQIQRHYPQRLEISNDSESVESLRPQEKDAPNLLGSPSRQHLLPKLPSLGTWQAHKASNSSYTSQSSPPLVPSPIAQHSPTYSVAPSPTYMMRELSTETLEYNDEGLVTKRTLSRTTSHSSFRLDADSSQAVTVALSTPPAVANPFSSQPNMGGMTTTTTNITGNEAKLDIDVELAELQRIIDIFSIRLPAEERQHSQSALMRLKVKVEAILDSHSELRDELINRRNAWAGQTFKENHEANAALRSQNRKLHEELKRLRCAVRQRRGAQCEDVH